MATTSVHEYPVAVATACETHWLPIPLDLYLNNVGTTSASDTSSGRFNVWGNSFPAESLPGGGRVTVDGIVFDLAEPGTGAADNVRCEGQYVTVPPGRYDWIYVLTAAERRAEDELALHFFDGHVQREDLRVSDFWAAVAAFGERAAFESSDMHYRRHVQPGVPATIWLQRVPVTRLDILVGLRLPRNVAVHLFALTLGIHRPVAAEDGR